RRRLSWAETLDLLAQLAEELEAAAADGTLPETLAPTQLWVQPTGRVQLLDTPFQGPTGGRGAGGEAALALLRPAAALALEGAPPRPLRAPVPRYAAAFLQRLLGGPDGFASLREVREALEGARERPAEVTRPRRGASLALATAALAPGLLFMLGSAPAMLFGWYVLAVWGAVLAERAADHLPPHAAAHVAAPAPRAPPPARLATAVLVQAEVRREADLRQRLERAPEERARLLRSSNRFVVQRTAQIEGALHAPFRRPAQPYPRDYGHGPVSSPG